MTDMREYLRENNLIEGIDDYEQDKQAMVAWRWLAEQRSMNTTVIKRVHKLLTYKQRDLGAEYKGVFRPIQVYIGNHVPPPPIQVQKEMTRWVHEFMGLEPKESHIRFETIHPFVDGNGRTGRMLMWWHERKLGREPTLLKADERHEYYKWFKGRGQPYEQTDLVSKLLELREENDKSA